MCTEPLHTQEPGKNYSIQGYQQRLQLSNVLNLLKPSDGFSPLYYNACKNNCIKVVPTVESKQLVLQCIKCVKVKLDHSSTVLVKVGHSFSGQIATFDPKVIIDSN